MGFGLLAGWAAAILVSVLVLSPLATETNMQKVIDKFGSSALLFTIYIPQLANLLVFWLVVRSMPKMDWLKEKMSFRTLFVIFIMMQSVSSVINNIGLLISKSAPAGGTEQLDMIAKMQSTKVLMGILIPVVIGPILEEIMFRKLMLDRIRCYGEKTAIIFSALCFGLFHGNLTQFLYAGCVGLFLGYVYCKTGKVLYTMIMHMLLNGIGSLILAVVPLVEGGSENGMVLGMIGILLVFVGLVVMTIAGFILLFRWIKRKSFVLDNSMPTCIPEEDVLKTVYLNPGVILYFALSFFAIITELFNLDINLFKPQK